MIKDLSKPVLSKPVYGIRIIVFMVSLLTFDGSNSAINAITLALTSGHTATTIPRSPDGASTASGFVYTITNPNGPNAIAAYRQDLQSGELNFIATYPTGGRGSGRFVDSQRPLVSNAEGTRLYAINPVSNDISVMAVKQDGALE